MQAQFMAMAWVAYGTSMIEKTCLKPASHAAH
jgi:UDP-N-acetylglucosamine enolpyruvyl transferase